MDTAAGRGGHRAGAALLADLVVHFDRSAVGPCRDGTGRAATGTAAGTAADQSAHNPRSPWHQERARTLHSADIHDDIGATLTQISMLSAISQNGEASPVLSEIRTSALDAVRSLDEIVWAVNPKNDNFLNFATYLCQSAGEFFRETGVACRIDLAGEIQDGPLRAEIRHHLMLAAREACNNALRHSGATEVSIHVSTPAGRIRIVVSDNGHGFDPGTIQEGDGLPGMTRRLCEAGGECTIETGPGGTRVKLECANCAGNHRQ